MNNRLKTLFKKKKSNILSVFVTAGYPRMNSLPETVEELVSCGVDMIEIGIPFSDPMADGPIIQKSSADALANGMKLMTILHQVRELRKKINDVPFVAMGYMNPIFQYGFEKFFRDGSAAGIDAVIIPDLPFEYYINNLQQLSVKYSIPVVMLITPETSESRIKQIDDNCEGFIYMVSSASTTGTRLSFTSEQIEYFKRINAMSLVHPRLIGFGISNPITLSEAFNYSSGAIVGSLFIKCIQATSSIKEAIKMLFDKLGLPSA